MFSSSSTSSLQQIEQRRYLTEWHLPVSPRLSLRDLTLLASSCKSVGCHMVVFSYRAAVGRPLPAVPTRADLNKIASASGLARILLRLDIEDIGEVEGRTKEEEESILKGLGTFLNRSSQIFDVFSILLAQDPLLFEKININEIFTPFLIKCPLIINIDDCRTSQVTLPRKRVPERSVIEFSQCLFVDSRNTINMGAMKTIRQQLLLLKRYRILVSCGGEQILPNDVEDAVISKIRSQVDSACLTEALCGRSDFLMTNKRLSLGIVLRMKAVQVKKEQEQIKKKVSSCGKPSLSRATKSNKKKQQLQQKQKKQKKAPASSPENTSIMAKAGKKREKSSGSKTKRQVVKSKETAEEMQKKVTPLNSKTLADLLTSQLLSKKESIKRRTQSKLAKRKHLLEMMSQEQIRKNKNKKKGKKSGDSNNESGKKRENRREHQKESEIVQDDMNFGWSEDF